MSQETIRQWSRVLWIGHLLQVFIWLMQVLTIGGILVALAAGAVIFFRYLLLPLLATTTCLGVAVLGVNLLCALSGRQDRLRDDLGRQRKRHRLREVGPRY